MAFLPHNAIPILMLTNCNANQVINPLVHIRLAEKQTGENPGAHALSAQAID